MKVSVSWSFLLVVINVIVVCADPWTSHNIDVTHKSFGDARSPQQTVKAHLLENLIDFLGLNSLNLSEVADELATIPHKMTADLTSATNHTADWIDTFLPATKCVDYTPTYLFTFSREDILEEFGSEYFLLKPSSNSQDLFVPKTKENDTTHESQQRRKQWLHVPKTGSSFDPTARNLGYPDNSHEPCENGESCEMIGLFREPSQRLISWFYYSAPVFEKCEMPKMKDATLTVYKEALQQCFITFLKESIYDGSETTTQFWGCQAKMLVGYHCDDPHIPRNLKSNVKLTQAALKKLHDTDYLKFIGNTDFFETSVTLIHQMLGGQLDIWNGYRKVNSRSQNEEERAVSGNRELDQIHYDSDFLCKDNVYCKNVPDDIIFQEVKRMMIENILKYHNEPIRVSGLSLYYFNKEELNEAINDANCYFPDYADNIRKQNKFNF